MRRRLAIPALAAFVLACGGAAAAWSAIRRPEETPAMRGREVARRLGCFACHGDGGMAGASDPRAPARRVPGWDGRTAAMFVTSDEEFREWVLHGRLSAPERAAESAGLIPMPAYEGRLSRGELDDLVAYFRAVCGWPDAMPDPAYRGMRAAERLGCFGCHGPSGMGGTPNPGSFKGHIPAWDGEEFEELVRDDDELREWILDGRIERLASSPLARPFLDAQVIQMPAYRDALRDGELDDLVQLVHWVRR